MGEKQETLDEFAKRVVDILDYWDTPEMSVAASDRMRLAVVRSAIKKFVDDEIALVVKYLEEGARTYEGHAVISSVYRTCADDIENKRHKQQKKSDST